MKYLIGVTGPARAGKSTVGDYFVRNYGFQPMSFALPVKQMLMALLQLTESELDSKKNETLDWLTTPWGKEPTHRYLMQTLGTEWGRDLVDKDIWLKLALRNIRRYAAHYKGIVFTDVRFENEAAMIRRNQGTIFHVQPRLTNNNLNHVSEHGIEIQPTDYVLENRGTIANLQQNAEHMFRLWKAARGGK